MKKNRIFWIFMILCMIICSLKTINASELALEDMKSNEINYISNNFSMNLPYQITYGGTIATHNATRITTLVNRQQGGDSTFYNPGNFKDSLFIASAERAGYYLYRMESADAYVTAYYTNVGTYIGEGNNEPINCVMTISNFRAGNTPLYGRLGYVGFCDKGLAWILLNDGTAKLNADIEVYFYFANDPTRTPIDLGEAYIGIGGMNSEKRVYNYGNMNDDKVRAWRGIKSDTIKSYLAQNDPGVTCGVQGAQWEWVSYDSNVVDSLKAFYISDLCNVKYVEEGATDLHVKDEDTVLGEETLSIYTWGYNSKNISTYEFDMDNPVDHNVISNAGMCFDSNLHADISEFTNYQQFSSDTIKRQCYMVQVARITNLSDEDDLVYSGGRTDGKPYSVYKFVGGKDVGSVEMALYPVSICNEVTTPKKTVNKTVAYEQEEIVYTISQKIGNMTDSSKRITQQVVYDSLVLTDNLPEEVELTYAVIKDGRNNTVAEYQNGRQISGNSNCVISYNPNTNLLICDFTEGYLSDTMEYKGETYTFQFKTKVRDIVYTRAAQDFIAKNKAEVEFDNTYKVETNEVETQILYDILTKGIHTTISEMITNIKGGEDGKIVVFTPELGYYVETVEWQTQSNRYDIPNATDIPNTNKVTIPEIKDGTENTYKHETTMTDKVPVDEKDTLNYDPFGTTTFTFNNVDNNHYIKVISVPMKMVIRISKEDAVTGKVPQGDATFEGAVYTIYSNEALTDIVETVTLDAEGNGSSTELPLGEYWIKETIAPDGYLIDENVYTAKQTAEIQTEQRLKVSYHDITSKDEVKKGRIEVMKFDDVLNSTEKVPSAGAVLVLTLDSNKDIFYKLTINENGYGEFINDTLIDYYPYTIPYGKYTITEEKESDAQENVTFFIQPTEVNLNKQHEQREYRIFSQPIPEVYLRVQKIDAVKGNVVKLAGAKFKIWDCEKEAFVEQMVTPSGEKITEFVTNENGEFVTPQKIAAGEYIVYETEAPAGYMLNPDWAIPENEADIGDKDKGGKYIKIDKVAMGIDRDTPATEADFFYTVEMPDEPLKGKLEITKTGEVLSDVTISSVGEFGEKYTPVYVQKGLPGVTYDIIAAEDIKSPDGTNIYVAAGSKVATITTNENGIATTPDLYLGEYEIVETVVPEGYIIDSEIGNVTIENNTKDEPVVTTKIELVNPRQKLNLTFDKVFEEIKFEFSDAVVATFGVYTNQDIKNDAGQIVIPKDSLVDLIEYTKSEDTSVTSTIDLPEGKYYVKELHVTYPYTVTDETIEIELSYDGSQNQYLMFNAGTITNPAPETTTISLIKLPTTIVENVVVDSNGIDDSEFNDAADKILKEIKESSKTELDEYFEKLFESGWKGLQGAEYEVYIDAECQKPLKISGEEVVLVSDKYGMMVLEDIPVGVYYLKETKAPAKYEITEDIIRIETTQDDKDAIAYRALKEDPIVITTQIQKQDIFTGEAVPNCVFEIYDETGEKVLMHSVTDENGIAHIAANLFEDGKTYFFKEISAPEQYKINTELQKFVAEFDENGNWISEKVIVNNTRKNIEELIVRKVDDETGEPLQGCKFSIIVLDENGEPVLDENGEYVYLVKEAVTDENGEYIVEKPYYGFYQFIEVEAPEGYELKVDMEGMTFVIDENSPETVIFEVTNTGDIAVYALTAVALVSILGIIYVTRKNKVAVK